MLHQCLTEESSSSLREWSFALWPGTLGLWWCCLRGRTCLSRNSNPGSAKSKGQGLTLSSMLHFYQHFFSRTYSFQSIKPSSATMSKMTQDAKKDEFRKYLEKAGVLELLTKSLVSVRLIVGLEYEYWNSDAHWLDKRMTRELKFIMNDNTSCTRNQRSQMMLSLTWRTPWGEGSNDLWRLHIVTLINLQSKWQRDHRQVERGEWDAEAESKRAGGEPGGPTLDWFKFKPCELLPH